MICLRKRIAATILKIPVRIAHVAIRYRSLSVVMPGQAKIRRPIRLPTRPSMSVDHERSCVFALVIAAAIARSPSMSV
jgi:hypothetical protein